MSAVRKGRQTPTQEVTLKYRKTHGRDAAEMYETSGRKLMRWQKLLLNNMLAHGLDKGKLWIHTRFGYEVPRRNGKGEVILARELYGLIAGEKILHTAHRTTTSHSAWERLCDLLSACGYEYTSYKAYGLESISSSQFDGKINFRTRSSKGGLGEGYDLLVIYKYNFEYQTKKLDPEFVFPEFSYRDNGKVLGIENGRLAWVNGG